MLNGRNRKDIQPGKLVRIVEKQNQKTGKLTEGNVERILTSSQHHPHGIKVQLKGGIVGRVKEILDATNDTVASTATNNDLYGKYGDQSLDDRANLD